jgi:hypothetical protein
MIKNVDFAREVSRKGVASCFFTLIAKNTKQNLAGMEMTVNDGSRVSPSGRIC